jgi:hypothetical protein
MTGFWHIEPAATLLPMLALALVLAATAATPVATISSPSFSKTITDADVASWKNFSGDELQLLIKAAWTEGEAAERGITVSQAEIDEEADPDLGLSKAKQAFLARISLLGARIQDPAKQAAAQSVTPDQVEAYVTANPRLDPEERTVRVLEARSRAQAKQALSAITRGLTWKSAARRYGRLRERTVVVKGPLNTGFEQNVLKADKARTTRFGTSVYRITKITPRRPAPLDVQRAQAWEILSSEAQRQAVAALDQQIRAKWLPRTVCAAAVATHPDCGNPPTGE